MLIGCIDNGIRFHPGYIIAYNSEWHACSPFPTLLSKRPAGAETCRTQGKKIILSYYLHFSVYSGFLRVGNL
jgi:hypothetical protein